MRGPKWGQNVGLVGEGQLGLRVGGRACGIYVVATLTAIGKLSKGAGANNSPNCGGVRVFGWACGIYVFATSTDFGKWGKRVGGKNGRHFLREINANLMGEWVGRLAFCCALWNSLWNLQVPEHIFKI